MSQHSRVSVAVVQLGYYPAALLGRRSAIEEPLFDFKKRGVLSRDFPPGVGARLGDLRQRVRDAYLGQYQKRIKTILEHCSGWGVNLVVFPEYSIPWQLLETVATMADGVVIVAGTHAVDPAALRSNVYTKIGTIEPRLGEAVCPILHGGKIIGLQAKLNPAAPEQGVMNAGGSWAPVPLPSPLSSQNSEPERVAIAWTVRNRAHKRGVSIAKLVCSPTCGPCCNGRPFSSARDATAANRELARRVLAEPPVADPTNGATAFFEPHVQDLLVSQKRPGYRFTSDQLRQRWRREGQQSRGTVGAFEFWA